MSNTVVLELDEKSIFKIKASLLLAAIAVVREHGGKGDPKVLEEIVALRAINNEIDRQVEEFKASEAEAEQDDEVLDLLFDRDDAHILAVALAALGGRFLDNDPRCALLERDGITLDSVQELLAAIKDGEYFQAGQ